MQELPNKKNQRFAAFEESFVHDVKDAKSLLQKELTVNHSEQILLQKRMQLMREFINDLPSSDPQYSMIATAIEMDQIELDELKCRSGAILQKMEQL
jgi:hypothetical protein